MIYDIASYDNQVQDPLLLTQTLHRKINMLDSVLEIKASIKRVPMRRVFQALLIRLGFFSLPLPYAFTMEKHGFSIKS